MTDCRLQCPIVDGGFCDRHHCRKTAQWVQLCVTKDRYYAAWEAGRGPGQLTQAPRKARGLGDTIAAVTRWFGIKQCCGCKRRQRWFNRMWPYARKSSDR